MFITIPKVFDSMGFGTVIGIAFFLLVLFAALTSSIALTESAVSTLQDELHWEPQKGHEQSGRLHGSSRKPLPAGLRPAGKCHRDRHAVFGLLRFLTNSVMMPIAAIASCILVSRVTASTASRTRSH